MNHDAVSVQICLDAGLSEAQADVLLTRLKGAQAPQPTAHARYQRLQGWSKRGIESLCISLDLQQEQTGGGRKACEIAASHVRGLAIRQSDGGGKSEAVGCERGGRST